MHALAFNDTLPPKKLKKPKKKAVKKLKLLSKAALRNLRSALSNTEFDITCGIVYNTIQHESCS